MTATSQEMKVASPPLVLRAAMVVSALVWVYHILILPPFPLVSYLSSLLRGLLHGFSLVVLALGGVSLALHRGPLPRWRWTWVAWLVVAVGWFPLTTLAAILGFGPVFMVLVVVWFPLLVFAERRALAR
ncbi:hypothetical protein [Corallococcus exiguus]|uniref:Uncharacterized protein n=1 Tax=Corallococcus exiguus TaxID=83462 RepID=A0A7X4YAN1_9BACT|nr:hypothetical protein [Corallococcus exiguus]NBC41931.1 hypothetical protein [Corallococcus exiguus]TNV65331.1 hypothetical protein FH620_10065 [Corallococcus exiguus]